MRFGVCIPHGTTFIDGATQKLLAREIEGMGFDSIWVSDHLIVPEGSGYIPEVLDEPLAVLGYWAGITERVTLGTSVLIVPYRHPVYTAKHVSTIDVLSSGRVVLGVGAGWLPEEFAALGAPFAERGAMTDEYLRAIRSLWETDTTTFHGRWVDIEAMRCFPKAAAGRVGTIPIVVGGNTAPSIRRAGELGDGWHPINLSPEQLADGVAAYNAAAARFGRTPGPVIMRHMPGGRTPPAGGWRLDGDADAQAADLVDYADAGCDELLLSWFARSPAELLERLDTFMAEVVPRSGLAAG